jgi:maleylacetoacetate isomerase
MLKLYSYFRSSSSYRVRIALNLKGLAYETIPVHLLRDGGEQRQPRFMQRNPAQLLPVLEHDQLKLTQSLAIIEYLEETHPTPSLLPGDAAGRARLRALALDIVCEIQPLSNLRVLQYLKSKLALDDSARAAWSQEWISRGFTAIEAQLARQRPGNYCLGTTPTLADCCLIPQVFNALRFNCRLDPYPSIKRIYEHCMGVGAFQNAAPERQIDAE